MDAEIRTLAHDIDEKGIACLQNYVSPAELGVMRAFVAAAIEKADGGYIGFKGPEQVAGSLLDDLAYCPCFRRIMRGIYEAGTGKPAPDQDYYQILRCLTGRDVGAHSMRFHYDTYILTALLPIEMPTEGLKGDLLVLPNRRSVRRTYASNLFDKLLLDNQFAQARLQRRARESDASVLRITPIPGNMYFFWGYRSIHTNEACDPDKVRATTLYHYVDPHVASTLKKALRPS